MGLTVAGMATVKEREPSFRRALFSIAQQVDVVYVVLNNYEDYPKWILSMPNVKPILGNNAWGDAGKFFYVENCKSCFYFSVDDDLLYPPNYVNIMKKAIAVNDCIVTLDGKRYDRTPVKNWKTDATRIVKVLGVLKCNVELHVGGTGAMAFRTNRFKLSLADFPVKNMADIWVAKRAREQGIRIVGVKHKHGWVEYLHPKNTSIWHTKNTDIEYQTSVVNDFLSLPSPSRYRPPSPNAFKTLR